MRGIKPESLILIVLNSFLFMGLVFLIVGLLMYNANKNFDTGDVGTTMATITDIDMYKMGNNKSYDVYITYNVNDMNYTTELNVYNSSMQVGKEIEITYKLNDPTTIHYVAGDLIELFIFSGIGCIFIIVGFVGIIIAFKKKRTTQMLFKQGTQIIGVISDVIQDKTITINGRCPYRVVATVLNPKTNEILEAYSEMYKSNPTPYIEIGSEITIYADLDKNMGVIKDITFKEKSKVNQDWVRLGD